MKLHPRYKITTAAELQIRGNVDPEGAARAFIERELKYSSLCWTDGPHLHRRTVTVTDWEPA